MRTLMFHLISLFYLTCLVMLLSPIAKANNVDIPQSTDITLGKYTKYFKNHMIS